jgi:cell division septation protein DedD
VTDQSHDSTDDGFHEIQLSGKQLVFLFMATTVVSVVIFLCGVLVGRSVRGGALAADAGTAASAGPGVSAPAPPPAPPGGEPPQPVDDDLSYEKRLSSAVAVPEKLVAARPADAERAPDASRGPDAEPAGAAEKPSAAVAAALKKPEIAKPAPSVAVAVGTPSPQPGVWAVPVVALTDRAAATAVVQRLTSKGYHAFLVAPQSGAPVQNYKVQVGKFDDRSQAEQIAGRLKKEEQFQPWILR